MALCLKQYTWSYSPKVKDILMERINRQRELSIGVSIEYRDHIPEHLIIEILSWLPVKSLLQFKSVCKLWYSIIKSSYFISKHLENYYNNNNNWRDCLIIQYPVTQACELEVYGLFVDDHSKKLLSYQMIETPVYNTYMCGPCDGIYFLWRDYSKKRYQSLWNPALNEFEVLPDLISKPDLPSYMKSSPMAYGFGSNSKTKDYKVIAICCYQDNSNQDYENSDFPLSLFIYSFKSNSWRYWGDLKNFYHLRRNKSYVFVNGCYYWLGSRESYSGKYEVIISFDIHADVCEEISLPKFEKMPCYGSQLVVYHDSIAFVCVSECQTNFSVWTCNEGVWTQKLNMEVSFQVWGAFTHWWDNMLLFSEVGKLVLCDTDILEMWELDHPNVGHGIENIIVYKESLVSIKQISTKQDEHIEIPDWFWSEMY